MADWQAIRAEYEQGASLRSLAAKYGISKSAIGERKYKEQWTQRTGNRTDTASQYIPKLPKDANHALRLADAIKHRQAGWTYQRIAVQCGYGDESQCRKAIKHALEQAVVQSIDEWRNDHISRLERLHEEVWTLAIDTNNKGRLFAIDRLLMIEERQAKLMGLDVQKDERPANMVVVREIPSGLLAPVESVKE